MSLSPIKRFALWPKAAQEEFLDSLEPAEVVALQHQWRGWYARPEQLAPPGDWATWLFCAGRACGKTRAAAEWVIEQARESPGSVGILIAATPGEAARVMVGGEARGRAVEDAERPESSDLSGILDISPPSFRPTWTGGDKGLLVWPNGFRALVFSAHNYEALRGAQCHVAWCDELAKWRYAQDAWDMLQMGLRLGKHARCCVTTTPRPSALLKAIMADPSTVVTRGTTYDNRENLAPNFLGQLLRKYEGTRLGRQELYADVLEDAEDALWTHARFDDLRALRPASWELRRVVVGVDPSGGSDEKADAQGIVVAGLMQDGTGRVIEDLTCKLSPAGWGARVVSAVADYEAECVVAERNFGGEMVEHVIQVAAKEKGVATRVKLVSASRGKVVRAEPIAGLYEQGKVRHCGTFSELEDELCLFTPGGFQGGKSPNRADAAVWALTELMGGPEPASFRGIEKRRITFGRGR